MTATATQAARILGMALASKHTLTELDQLQVALADSLAGGAANQAEVDSAIHSLEAVAVAREQVKEETERIRASRTILREIH